MGARNREGKPVKFYALKAKVDKENSPFFAVSEKIDGKWKNTEQFTEVFGKLTKAEITQKEFEGVTSDLYNLTLSDDDENSVIQLTQNQITYNIINSLLSLENFDGELSIRVYKSEDTNNDGRTFYNGRAYVTFDGEKTEWALNMKEDVPRPEQLFKANGEPLLQQGKKVFDHEGVHNFWKNEFKKIIEKLKNTSDLSENTDKENNKNIEPPKEKIVPEKTSSYQEEGEDDDLPF